MVVLFVLVIAKRDTIRAYWWVHRLRDSAALADRAYYVACLASVGDSAAGALNGLVSDDRAENRALVIPASQGMSRHQRMGVLARLLGDDDGDVRQSAATALAFSKVGDFILISQSHSKDAKIATAAIGGLARMNSIESCVALCEAAVKNTNPWVRAQAVESLGQQLSSNHSDLKTLIFADEHGDINPLTALVSALSDSGEFSGTLALESEIAAVTRAVTASKGIPTTAASTPARPADRTVAQIAAQTLSSLCGRTVQPGRNRTVEEKRALVQQCRESMVEQQTTSRPQRDQ